jgi:hypothetical protein
MFSEASDAMQLTTDRWLFMRSFIMDGNFSAEHLKMRQPETDVQLTDGCGFMVTTQNYQAHLAVATEPSKVCSHNRGLSNVDRPFEEIQLQQSPGRESSQRRSTQTGVDRHRHDGLRSAWLFCSPLGCQFPEGWTVNKSYFHSSALVNLLESRQMNMDYSLCQALKYNMDGIKTVLILYDVMCQFGVHLVDWVEKSLYLDLPLDLTIKKGIGLFHIHGHQDSCYPRFSPTFIQGAGQVDGEILETLWAPLNQISGSSRSMTAAHRQELLDDHMNDSNWKKQVKAGMRRSWSG